MKLYCPKCDPEATIKIKWTSKEPCICPACGETMVEINDIMSALFVEKIVEKPIDTDNQIDYFI
jgi:peptide subunit release factor 1 (eRF1)